MARPYVIAALEMDLRRAKSLRADLRITSRLGDRKGVAKIYRAFMGLMKGVVDLIDHPFQQNPPNPLIALESLRKAFLIHKEVLGALYSDQPDFTNQAVRPDGCEREEDHL